MAYDYGNVLDAMARGVKLDPFGNFAEGWGKGQQGAALQQKMEEARQVRNALQRAAQHAQTGDYKGAAASLFEGNEAGPGVSLLTSSDPNMQANRESYFAPMIVKDKNGQDVLIQPSNKNNVRQLNDYGVSPRWDYGVDAFGNSFQRPKQGGNGAGPTPGMPQYAPGEAKRVEAGAAERGKTEGVAYAEAKRDQPQAKTRLDYTVAAVDDLLKQPGLTRQTGIKGRILGWLNPQERINFEAQAQKVNGQTLLAMLDTLKVLKPVSDTDAKATTQAAINLDAWQDPALYAKGARFYQKFLRDNYDILAKRAVTPPGAAQETSPQQNNAVADPDEGKTIVNKATGQRMIRQNGQWINAQ